MVRRTSSRLTVGGAHKVQRFVAAAGSAYFSTLLFEARVGR